MKIKTKKQLGIIDIDISENEIYLLFILDYLSDKWIRRQELFLNIPLAGSSFNNALEWNLKLGFISQKIKRGKGYIRVTKLGKRLVKIIKEVINEWARNNL